MTHSADCVTIRGASTGVASGARIESREEQFVSKVTEVGEAVVNLECLRISEIIFWEVSIQFVVFTGKDFRREFSRIGTEIVVLCIPGSFGVRYHFLAAPFRRRSTRVGSAGTSSAGR